MRKTNNRYYIQTKLIVNTEDTEEFTAAINDFAKDPEENYKDRYIAYLQRKLSDHNITFRTRLDSEEVPNDS